MSDRKCQRTKDHNRKDAESSSRGRFNVRDAHLCRLTNQANRRPAAGRSPACGTSALSDGLGLDRVRNKIRVKHYSIRTEQAYCHFIKRFILIHGKQHPDTLGAPEVEAFLTHLTVDGNVSAATQNLAKSAVLFLYREILERDLP